MAPYSIVTEWSLLFYFVLFTVKMAPKSHLVARTEEWTDKGKSNDTTFILAINLATYTITIHLRTDSYSYHQLSK